MRIYGVNGSQVRTNWVKSLSRSGRPIAACGRVLLEVSRPLGWAIGLICLVLLGLVAGCERCQSAPLARLTEKIGVVKRDHASEPKQWRPAEKGTTFEVGDAIRTESEAEARLRLDDGSILGLEEETLIRFLERRPGAREQAIDLKLGGASLEAPTEGTVLRTAFGLAKLEGGTKVELVRREDSLRYEVVVGHARVETPEGGVLAVAEGQTVEATLGEAVVEYIADEAKGEEEQDESEGPEAHERSAPILATVQGDKVTLTAPGEAEALELPAGDRELEAGSILRVGEGSSVSLSRGHENAKLSAGGRYLIGGGGHLVQAKQGGTLTVSSEKVVRIKVPGGTILTKAGSAQIASKGEEGTQVTAHSGLVTLSGTTNERLSPGEQGLIEADGSVSVEGRGLSHADLDVSVGQSVVIHDPSPPTAVSFQFGDHCMQGTVRLKGSRSAIVGDDFARGKEEVALGIGPGRVRYSLHCNDEDGKEGPAVASGAITVLHDAGTKPVPRQAPSTYLDVNGRSYTVLYQNQLPRITVRWAKHPEDAEEYVLKRKSPGVERSYTLSQASYTFSPGTLREGTHTVYFKGGGRVSRRTSITIRFDNAAPTASLQTPAQAGVGPGGQLHLSGIGLPGWSVVVDGKSIAQDADGRFSVNTTMPSNGRPVAVRLSHPSRGTHIYLRRPAGSP